LEDCRFLFNFAQLTEKTFMIAVETVIRKLVSEYEFVIIPGFGALLSHQIPAAYDEASQSFSPPAKRLAFNEFLKLDDGLLANYISRHESLSHSEAVDYVKKYTDKLRINLEESGQAEIAGIGEFRKNIEGKLVFEPNTGKYFKDEWYGFEKITASKFKSKATPLSIVPDYIENDRIEVLESEESSNNAFRWGRWAVAATIAAILCGLSVFFVNTKTSDIQSTLNPFTELFSRSGSVETKQETVAVKDEPVVEATNSEKSIDSVTVTALPKEPVKDVKKEVLAVDTVKSNTVKLNGVKQEPIAGNVAIAKTAPLTSKYYAIAGTFKGMRQARILLAELKEKGFAEASILPPSKAGKKVKVAVNGFDSEIEAYRASNRLATVIGEAGWVYERN
jgi:nucleoid DNA-binding protein/cell division septation protein DedD